MWVSAIVFVFSLNEIKVHESIPQGKTFKWTSPASKFLIAYLVIGIIAISLWLEYKS